MPTGPIAKLKADVFKQFPSTWNGGDENCRKIKNSTTWSQHAWGNALDIMVPNLGVGDQVYRWVLLNRAKYGLGTILWRVPDHYDHVHAEGLPKQRGTPPCAGGSGRQPTPSPGDSPSTPTPGAPGGDNPFIPDAIETVGDAVGILFEPQTWIRVGLFLGGSALIGGGLIILARELGAPGLKELANLIPAGRVAKAVAG